MVGGENLYGWLKLLCGIEFFSRRSPRRSRSCRVRMIHVFEGVIQKCWSDRQGPFRISGSTLEWLTQTL